MGIAFHDLAPESQAALEKWVSEAPGQQGTIESFVSSIERDLPPALLRQPSNELVELIQLLVKKGVLTKAEALGLLKLPLDE
jgi:hypothetical protein